MTLTLIFDWSTYENLKIKIIWYWIKASKKSCEGQCKIYWKSFDEEKSGQEWLWSRNALVKKDLGEERL